MSPLNCYLPCRASRLRLVVVAMVCAFLALGLLVFVPGTWRIGLLSLWGMISVVILLFELWLYPHWGQRTVAYGFGITGLAYRQEQWFLSGPSWDAANPEAQASVLGPLILEKAQFAPGCVGLCFQFTPACPPLTALDLDLFKSTRLGLFCSGLSLKGQKLHGLVWVDQMSKADFHQLRLLLNA